ncbi:MAG: hypothetical protein LBS72_01820 [Oscillospiraceae bacterium]|jgi:hypothetical protein|nr:hypothetical protein [Oscillospiraceae bacterium]
MKRISHAADYIESYDENGGKKVQYAGPLFVVRWNGTRSLRLIQLWALAVGAAAVFIGFGTLPIPDLPRRPWIMAPYVASFWPVAMLIADAYKISAYSSAVTRPAAQSGVGRLRRDAIFGEALALIVFVGQAGTLLAMAAGRGGVKSEELFFLILAAAYILLFEFVRRLNRFITLDESMGTSADAL